MSCFLLSSQVFGHFLFGFPPHWDTYAANLFKDVAADDDSENHPTSMAEPKIEPKSPSQTNVIQWKRLVSGLAKSKTPKCKPKIIGSVSSDPKRRKKNG